jgi:hypothetical protein
MNPFVLAGLGVYVLSSYVVMAMFLRAAPDERKREIATGMAFMWIMSPISVAVIVPIVVLCGVSMWAATGHVPWDADFWDKKDTADTG